MGLCWTRPDKLPVLSQVWTLIVVARQKLIMIGDISVWLGSVCRIANDLASESDDEKIWRGQRGLQRKTSRNSKSRQGHGASKKYPVKGVAVQ